MTISSTALSEPVSEEDVMDVEDYLDSTATTVKSLFERTQHQGADPRLTGELWAVHCLLLQAANQLATLRSQGCFPPDALVRP
jgi:hypothetical protein